MLTTPHLLTGAAIGLATGNPVLSFAGGFVSHFVLDTIPHADGNFSPTPDVLNITFKDYPGIIFEILVGLSFTLYFTLQRPEYFGVMILGAVGTLLPDLISNIPLWSKRIRSLPVLKQFHALHHFVNHRPWSEVSLLTGITTQIIVVLLATIFILH
jgi:hypothetical protein